MQTIKVELERNSYEVRVGAGILPRAGAWLRDLGYSGKAVIITDTTVKGLYADVLSGGLARAGFSGGILEIPPGEGLKTLEIAGGLYERLTDAYVERTTPVIALGGGVIGDIAGFVAATYLRGVPLVQVPTTLLAQVDSSVGGKTAVDHGLLKNMIGAFYQPRLVIADVDTLKTLPADELSNGMAEVVKHAAILDAGLFHYLEKNIAEIMARDAGVLEEIVARNVRIKAGVVAQDERETGLRAVLNFGHTVGHAVEAVSGFTLKHGQAVAIGMAAEAEISRRVGKLNDDAVSRLKNLLVEAGLPVSVLDIDIEAVVSAMRHDKKVTAGHVRFVLLDAIGEAYVTDAVSPSLVREVLSGHG
jgi:3-dehydroquinate synthase